MATHSQTPPPPLSLSCHSDFSGFTTKPLCYKLPSRRIRKRGRHSSTRNTFWTNGAKPMKPRTVAQGTRTRNRMESKGLERRCADLGYSRGVSHALENQIVQ
ncbi:hypothetical protein FOQG_06218 [Fusarium oxysporum f. sp. raphani 54005]|uniref:Uncharacterized protein n=4 Tax=Fusarium oxysporum TaxID=5507 RepID=X0DA21_FUSOX|nr:hypothetical protein FOVG_08598 [Fusarium oxysporum f. sp. pisi HDV247]EXK91437.1 hypothetical protein FOQG_06218 [Fusarium oxysporum f. sp. raphani 54005]EXL84416.1 hypothetical protein FOPG_03434 [Fusarium oxysporum f. sp. conglutinans race 2 54008]EXM33543.1 hypothetical protein FOTG_02178 [Fusarium oxysporum f. sp. vasinfectum 25433]